YQSAEVLIALSILSQQRDVDAKRRGHTTRSDARFEYGCYFRPYVSADVVLLSRQVKSRRAIKSISIEKSHRRHAKLMGGLYKLFWQRCAFEETEGRPRMHLYVLASISHDSPHTGRLHIFSVSRVPASLLPRLRLSLLCSVIDPFDKPLIAAQVLID